MCIFPLTKDNAQIERWGKSSFRFLTTDLESQVKTKRKLNKKGKKCTSTDTNYLNKDLDNSVIQEH